MEIRKGPIEVGINGSWITCYTGGLEKDGHGHIVNIQTITFDAVWLDTLIELLQEARKTEGVKKYIARLTNGLI